MDETYTEQSIRTPQSDEECVRRFIAGYHTKETLVAYRAGSPQFDDVTVVLVEFAGP